MTSPTATATETAIATAPPKGPPDGAVHTDSPTELRAAAGDYLTFKLGDEEYGIEILRVQEIIGLMTITRVPGAPAFIRGVLNLRGKVIPVVDQRLKFGLEPKEDTEITCIIVVEVFYRERQLILGMLVDEVSEVAKISAGQLEAPPELGTETDFEFILGLAKTETGVIVLLDIDQLLTRCEAHLVSHISLEP